MSNASENFLQIQYRPKETQKNFRNFFELKLSKVRTYNAQYTACMYYFICYAFPLLFGHFFPFSATILPTILWILECLLDYDYDQ